MRHLYLFLASLLVIALSLIGWTRSETARARVRGQEKSAALFVVFGASDQLPATMEPILLVQQGAYKQPIAGDSDQAEIDSFTKSYYRSGQKYRILFGGGEAGTATVKKYSNGECFRTGADVSLQTPAKLNRNVMALATDSETLGRVAMSRSAPTQAERTAALKLAREAFIKQNVPAALLANMEVVNLTATDLDRDGKLELIGSFVAIKRRGGQARYPLFLVAEAQGQGYRTALALGDKITADAIMSGASIDAVNNSGIYVERLVDQLDLDGNGVAEIITTTTGFEGVSYFIYKKSGAKWEKIYEFANYRCAF